METIIYPSLLYYNLLNPDTLSRALNNPIEQSPESLKAQEYAQIITNHLSIRFYLNLPY